MQLLYLFRSVDDRVGLVLSEVRRDRIDKMIDYARFGVRWYWIVDPVARIFQILELDDSRRYAIVVAESGGTVRAPGCRGLKLDLDKLWASVDRLLR